MIGPTNEKTTAGMHECFGTIMKMLDSTIFHWGGVTAQETSHTHTHTHTHKSPLDHHLCSCSTTSHRINFSGIVFVPNKVTVENLNKTKWSLRLNFGKHKSTQTRKKERTKKRHHTHIGEFVPPGNQSTSLALVVGLVG